MTAQQKQPAAEPAVNQIAWLQPVRLPFGPFTEFAARLNESLQQLEADHGVSPREEVEPAFASIKRFRRAK